MNAVLCGLYRGLEWPRKIDLDAYEEHGQFHREEIIIFLFQLIPRLFLAIGYQQDNKPSSVYIPAGEGKLLQSQHC